MKLVSPRLSAALVLGLVAVWAVGQEWRWRGQLVGLPPLPPEFVENADEDGRPKQEGQRETMLRQAFGSDSEEINRPVRLLMRDKGIVVSAGQFSIEDDGRVKFAPFSAAIFLKNKDGGYPEINTFRCDFAFLTLDKPVQMPWELGNRALTAVELRGGGGGVKIINNRRTPEENDDLEMHVTTAPLFYEARRNLIWSDGYVNLSDFQSQPKPTVVIGKGMEMHLTPDSGPNKPNVEGISNVELLILRSNVSMHFYLDSYEGFLDGNNAAPAPKMPGGAQVRIVQAEGHRDRHNDLAGVRDEPAKNPPDTIFPEKFRIRTNGPFTYDLTKGLAWFDSPPRSTDGKPPTQPTGVLLLRDNPTEMFDQLLCDHLKLQFRKNTSPSAKPAATETPKEPTKKAEPKDEKKKLTPKDLPVYLADEICYHYELDYEGAHATYFLREMIVKGLVWKVRAVGDHRHVTLTELDLSTGLLNTDACHCIFERAQDVADVRQGDRIAFSCRCGGTFLEHLLFVTCKRIASK